MRPTRAFIHRQNLVTNIANIRALCPPGTLLCAAVKANAYGHATSVVVPWMVEEGIEAFGVATVEEGVQLRSLGVVAPILLLGSLQPEEIGEAVEADLDLCVWTKPTIEVAIAAARGREKPLRVHLKVDTGMGRVGCRPDEAEDLAEQIVRALPLEFGGVCTHFASSDGPGPLLPDAQLAVFHEVLSILKARGWTPRTIHAANSGGISAWPSSHFNMVRPGISLYGYPPPPHDQEGHFRPVMELVSRVGFVKAVPAGTPLSYGSRYVTERPTEVATIPLGYADGYRRAFTNRAPVQIGDRLFRVSGTVCMDQFLVDVGPDSGIKTGDPVVLFGPQRPAPTATDLGRLADTISYEIVCGVSARVPRIGVE